MKLTPSKSNQIFDKENITIIVTDSGLGGLSITADIAERLKDSGVFNEVRIIFFNASFDNKSGYNVIDSHDEKIHIFNNALTSMERNYHPDLILIGCNTLSVIYPETPFSKFTSIPVIGIVEIGVQGIYESLKSAPEANVIIFATKTTIQKETYQNELMKKGIPHERIIGIQCANLADKIEEGFESEETKHFISHCVSDAIATLDDKNSPVIVSLNCTHYGYVAHLFQQEFARYGIQPIIINPNPHMADFLFQQRKQPRWTKTAVSIEVICKVTIFPDVMLSIGELIRRVSPQTLHAMQKYKQNINLF